ncbi:FtsQ-type POTRA domain-containing protein [Microcella daejeonensis]|uniref:FtsQ-type POTRA domain-containing protein n=1 Tax=Microcella daejeonensis TaxID=2994971 RepID=A0A9E8MKP9_9MICO|nr:FtsQ-type POTRA domain-containing protein [Microcella daejeonensis]WAB81360.1 FtsQ-type POTRA domain-containing protein [Microcella daejeonensis]
MTRSSASTAAAAPVAPDDGARRPLLDRWRPAARTERPARAPRAVDPAAQARAAERAARAAARAARRAERTEVRRFTRRSRRRRILVISVTTSLVALVAGVGAVTVSPLMALTEITVTGAQRLDAAAVTEALDEHTGTPLALLDHEAIRDDLRAFPLIRSYSTEVVPPHTLVVRLVERTPIGAVERAGGVALVDAAGVVVDTTAERPAGVPLIEAGDADAESVAFRSAAAVLAVLPADLVARIDVISATTRDDVTFTFADTGHRVRWGSAERSDFKARVLAAAIATSDQSVAWQYDVSAPDSLIARRL